MFIYYPRSFGEVRVWRGSCYSCLYITPGLLEGSCLERFVLLMFIYYPRSFGGFVFGEVRVTHVYILPQVFWLTSFCLLCPLSGLSILYCHFGFLYVKLCIIIFPIILGNAYKGPSLPWSYGSWIKNYLCNQSLSPLKLWVRTPLLARCTRYNIMW